MLFEMTIQIRVPEFEKGLSWYQLLLGKEPDFIPHDGFAEWEIVPGSWVQLGEGEPAKGSGPLRFGVNDIDSVRERLVKELNITDFEIFSREEVPVKWGTFSDPWGNLVGFFEYLDKTEETERIKTILVK
ncbi:VOC family protein [Ornithinibacillus contaminans]|uniref:VOC family protein n=1 Tax=Ornithinibacillus contaminans TaxID=694055 RepID=UPI00064DC7A9|nr:VOC family protein [Ornithinibacillus contaminans]